MTADLFIRGRVPFTLYRISLSEASDVQLTELSHELGLGLNLCEMRTIKAYFKKEGREPSDVELQTISQTWSEHCYHKTFKGKIRVGS
jgi:phosphoribosylformylglycinamidine (FGAM) synthase-like enzyme